MADIEYSGDQGSDSDSRVVSARTIAKPADEKKQKYEPTQDAPQVFRRKADVGDGESALDVSKAIARSARDTFRDACAATDADEAEAQFASMKQKVNSLWVYAHLRDRAYRDLLSLVAVAIKHAELRDFNDRQREAILQAITDLPRLFLDDSAVESHIDQFADCAIDQIVGPITPAHGKKLKVTIEEIE